jgi:hypothetical protein
MKPPTPWINICVLTEAMRTRMVAKRAEFCTGFCAERYAIVNLHLVVPDALRDTCMTSALAFAFN